MKKKRKMMSFPRGKLLKMKLLSILTCATLLVSAVDSYYPVVDSPFLMSDNSLETEGGNEIIEKDEKVKTVHKQSEIQLNDRQMVKFKQQQEGFTVSGTITDQNSETLPGVNILEKGTVNGTISDIDGNFTIELTNGNAVLLFTFIGYKDLEVPVKNRTTINVQLDEKSEQLDEVVVVGMGEQRKASVIGAIDNVEMEDLKVPSRSLTNALAGRLAGAVVVQRSGEIGRDNSQFWIRGISTFGADRSPLILVDGVERDMQDLSAEEVASVSILKDASATAVYGVRAANGVVLVTTRKGRKQKPVIEVKMESGISDLPKLPDYLDGVKYAGLYNEALGRKNYSDEYISNTKNQTDPYLYPNVDWFDETYTQFSSNSQATVNVRGGGEVARYFVGFGYFNEVGNLKNTPETDYDSNLKLDRYNFRSNVDINITKTTVIDLEVGGHVTDLHTPGLGQTLYGTTYSPVEELFWWSNMATPISNPVKVPIGIDKDGNEIMGWGAPSQVGEKNPAERLLGSGYNTEFRNQFMSQVTLNQDLDMVLDGLKAKFSYSFDAYNRTTIQRKKSSTTYGVVGRDEETNDLIVKEVDKGQEFLNYSRSLQSNRAKEMKFQVLYDKVFAGAHRFGGMLMYYQRDFINGNASSSILALPYRRQGIASRVTYDFRDRYFAEFNLGYNGSENFPKGNRFGFFPAFAGGWLVSNEPFWNDFYKISHFKLKGSIGLVGAEQLPGGQRYGYLSVYGAGLGGYSFGNPGTAYSGVGLDRIGVTDLTWEKGLKKNIGFEIQMFNGDFSLDVDYFHEKRTDILLQRTSLPDIVGINSQPFANLGEMLNRGIDGTIEVSKEIGKGGIRFYGNFTYAKDKILEQDEPERNFDYRQRTGHKYGQHFGLVALGYFEDEHDIENSPEQTFGDVRPGDVKFLDVNGDGKVTVDDEVPIGYSSIPEINYGFGAQGFIGGLDIGVFFRGQARVSYRLGGDYIPFREGVGKRNLFKEAMDRWTVENPDQDAQYPRLFNGTSANNWQASTFTLYDGSFLRLADIELGYTIKSGIISKFKMNKLRLYVIGNNVALLSKWKMWDPETGTTSGNTYPMQRKFNFGIRGTF